jgi:hypothetical protein
MKFLVAILALLIGLVRSCVGLLADDRAVVHPPAEMALAPPPDPLVLRHDRISGDAAEYQAYREKICPALKNGDVETLESTSRQALAPAAVTPSGVPRIWVFYFAVEECMRGYRADDRQVWMPASASVAAWQKKYPGSASARVTESELHLTAAWAARGDGYDDDVTEQARKEFNAELSEARKTLESSRDISSKDPDWYRQMVDIFRYQAEPRDAVIALVQEGFDRYPEYYPTVAQGFRYMLPKYGESSADMAVYLNRFIDAAGRRGAVLDARVVDWLRRDRYWPRPLEDQFKSGWLKVKQGLEEIRTEYPDPANLDAEAAMACSAGDQETLSALLDSIADSPILSTWSPDDGSNRYLWCKQYAEIT